MNIIDIVIIFSLLLGGFAGARNGFFKQSVVLIGTIVCFILSWLFKDIIANFLSYHLPFFGFGSGLTSLNIVMYQLISFLLLMCLFSAVLVVLIKMSGVFEKILKMTIILGIPSKILGFVLGVLEAYVILFVALFFVKQPAFDIDIVNESRLTEIIVTSSPGLSNIVSDMNDAIGDIYSISKNYHDTQNSNKFNKEVVDSLLKHKVVDEEYLNKLREKGKINY